MDGRISGDNGMESLDRKFDLIVASSSLSPQLETKKTPGDRDLSDQVGVETRESKPHETRVSTHGSTTK